MFDSRNIVILLLPVILVGAGCIGQVVQPIDGKNRKVVAMDRALQAVARESIRREKRFFGKPLQINYSVTIEPQISNGYATFGSLDRFSDFEVPIFASYTCANETIGAAKIAVVFEAVLGADHQLRSGPLLFQWEGEHWVSAEKVALEQMRKIDPQEARKIARLLDEEHRSRNDR